MEKNDDKRQQMIREVLAVPGGDSGADTLARAMLAWVRLAAHLSPLIGEAGFCALYGRAVRLSSPEGDWPAATHGVRSIAALLATLNSSLAAVAPSTASAANAALLETFTRLLAGLIGEALTIRLLNTAWAVRPDGKST
ncbi:hypothetical protein [Massilia glaciei]|nr:hypothetical protein [Massilia glaciei]